MSRRNLRSAAVALGLCWRAGQRITTAFALVSLLTGLLPATIVWITKLLIDSVATQADLGRLLWLVATLGAAGLVAAVLPRLAAYLQAELGRRIDARLQDLLYSAVNQLQGMARLETPEFRDRLQTAQQSSGQTLGPGTSGLFVVAQNFIKVVSVSIVLFVVAPAMAVIALAAAIPALLAEVSISRRRVTMLARLSPALRRRRFYGLLLVDLRAAKEIRLLGLGGCFQGRMQQELATVHLQQRCLDRRELWMQTTLAVLAAAITGGGLMYVVVQASAGTLTVGDVSVFVTALVAIQAALSSLVGQISQAYEALALFAHFRYVTSTPNDLPSAIPARSLPTLEGSIEVRDVWFRYRADLPWVLRGVTLTIRQGSAVAIVGLNGSGKSTLVKLLCRFYDPTHGEILWDGVDIRSVPVSVLREKIGALFQDFMKYDFTAADNIGVGDVDRMDMRHDVVAAATRAGVHDTLVALRSGYDTMLSLVFSADSMKQAGSGGLSLSGGQWQRVALGRALMRDNRDLLILDEPSSGLDPEAEQSIHDGLLRLRNNRTSLLISHRLGSIRDADAIHVLAGGSIVERGSHANLMQQAGEYAKLFALQAAGYKPLGVEAAEETHVRSSSHIPMARSQLTS